jgi:pimeloyl-ACP methyl ester carboxylesterase
MSSPERHPTIILVHGAFADASSWDAVADQLRGSGFAVVTAGNPLRKLDHDAASISALVKSIEGPVTLVGHSYGGSVATGAAVGAKNVRSLVYVAGFAPDAGESAADLSAKYPGSQLGDAIAPAPMSYGDVDLYIRKDRFHHVFAADVPPDQGLRMASGQRPVTQAALGQPASTPAWRSVPSWFIYGSADRCIPPAALEFMAVRAKSRKTVVVSGASHAVMVAQPDAVARLITEAAASTGG